MGAGSPGRGDDEAADTQRRPMNELTSPQLHGASL